MANEARLAQEGCDSRGNDSGSNTAAVVRPPGLRAHERIAAAKILKGIGPASAQRSIVQMAIGNGWNNLRPSDGQPTRIAPNGRREPSREEREANDVDQLEKLKASRAERGIPEFRDPGPHESPAVYEDLREAAASSDKRSAAKVRRAQERAQHPGKQKLENTRHRKSHMAKCKIRRNSRLCSLINKTAYWRKYSNNLQKWGDKDVPACDRYARSADFALDRAQLNQPHGLIGLFESCFKHRKRMLRG